ncbi:MAG: hypothetical protein HZB50_02485 [Chloroflexi bacterium]|nr:hypothetical protein [Chloroflexota bacterium]
MITNITSQTKSYVLPIWKPRLFVLRILYSVSAFLPRPRTMLISFLFFGGLSIPALMALSILPFNFLMAFIGLAMTTAGGVMALIYCGDIY